MLSKYLYVLPLGCLGILGGDFKPYPIIHLEFKVIRGKEINLIHGLLVQILMIFYKPIRFYYIFLWSIPKRVYQNNAAVILHLIKYIVATIVAVAYVFYCLPWKKPRSRSSEAGVCDKKLSL